MPSVPPSHVLSAFRVTATPCRLAGGQGEAWRAGDVVLKSVSDVAEAEWAGDLLSSLPEDGFRVARPVRSNAGTWAYAGWSASRWVDGRHESRRSAIAAMAVAVAFHRALRHLPRPSFLDARVHPWAVGDRMAWGEEPLSLAEPRLMRLAESFTELVEAPAETAQVVHGDLYGNVLYADGLAPAVIDVSPYFRPPSYALGIIVADGLAWYGDGDEVIGHMPCQDRASAVARAAIFRLVATDRHLQATGDPAGNVVTANVRAMTRVREALASASAEGFLSG
jgi:uncharacterized protein (TIGR02569 family)